MAFSISWMTAALNECIHMHCNVCSKGRSSSYFLLQFIDADKEIIEIQEISRAIIEPEI